MDKINSQIEFLRRRIVFLENLKKVEDDLPPELVMQLLLTGSMSEVLIVLIDNVKRDYSISVDWLISTLRPAVIIRGPRIFFN